MDIMKKINHQTLLCIAMLIGTAAACMLSLFASFAQECEGLEDEVFRLHILANSDSDFDQGIKYRLRDEIVTYAHTIFEGAENAAHAMSLAEEDKDKLEKFANDFLAQQNISYTAQVEVTQMYFTTRTYENYTVPAGNYRALRIILGEGEGKNWWCVLYPPLCLPACSDELYFSDELSRKIEGSQEVQVKFALYEFLADRFGE